jgi:protein-disulfide isomerase
LACWALGVLAVPTMFVNGRRVVGARSIRDLRQVVDEALASRTAPTGG